MKRDSGVTLTSLIIYVIAMVVVVATIATLTKYFYGNIDRLSEKTNGAKEYTAFNSYFTNEINDRSNKILAEVSSNTKLVFSNGNQYTFSKKHESDLTGLIYLNKMIICRDVKDCRFEYNDTTKLITVKIEFKDKQEYENTYKLANEN